MKNANNKKATNPIDSKEEIQKSKDQHIDQDFENYPKGPASEANINPKSKSERLTARAEKHEDVNKAKPPKKKEPKAGDSTNVEKVLANTLGGSGSGKVSDKPTKVDRLSKQKK